MLLLKGSIHLLGGMDQTEKICLCIRLRCLPKTLLRFPCEAVFVQLAGFKPLHQCQELERISYSPEWSIKALLEMMDLLHGKLRAVVMV